MLTRPAPPVGLSWGTRTRLSSSPPSPTSLLPLPGGGLGFPARSRISSAGQLHVHRLRQGPEQAPHGSLQPGQEGASSAARHLCACLSLAAPHTHLSIGIVGFCRSLPPPPPPPLRSCMCSATWARSIVCASTYAPRWSGVMRATTK